MEKINSINQKAWVVAVSMGYGHQRTAYPLKYLATGQKIINANDYEGIPKKDWLLWERIRKFYEFISRFKRVSIIGQASFFIFDQFQKILSFYPKRDLSKPNFSLKQIFSLIKKGWGKDLIKKLEQKPLPFITTFFTPAFMAEVFNYPGEIFCVVCDADISRSWVFLEPQKSKIKYFAPTSWAAHRLKLYGVKEENIFLTGYPLPQENLGHPPYGRVPDLEILKSDLSYRLLNLDPDKIYFRRYKVLIEEYLGSLPKNSNHPLTIMFSVGGAGVQKEIGIQIVKSLARTIGERKIKLILVAGTREKVKEYFLKNIKKLGLEDTLGKGVEIIFAQKIDDYFQRFNQALRTTDILWTKPSELSFYTALGLPIIIAPSIGSQEDFNRRWLLHLGSGIAQENPKYVHQWLFDFLESGRFAEAAMQGFIEGEKLGTFKIKKIIFNKNSVSPV